MSRYSKIAVRLVLVLLLSLSGLAAASPMMGAAHQAAMDQGNSCATYCLSTPHFAVSLPAPNPLALVVFAAALLYVVVLLIVTLPKLAGLSVAARPRPSPPLYKLAVCYLD